ncbi:MAG: acyl-CoA thioesterase [Myxococcales bacterium]|nr:MAG: acyl-CoA thioesterase [Myxococcales bacterium]
MFRFDREDLKISGPHAFVFRCEISFQQIDAAGIIFYPRVLEMFHDAYAAFLAAAGAHLRDVMRTDTWIAPVRHAEADYFKPLRLGDVVHVEIAHVHASETEATLGYRVVRVEGDELCAVGQVVHTFVDRAAFKRIPIPERVRLALQRIHAGP